MAYTHVYVNTDLRAARTHIYVCAYQHTCTRARNSTLASTHGAEHRAHEYTTRGAPKEEEEEEEMEEGRGGGKRRTETGTRVARKGGGRVRERREREKETARVYRVSARSEYVSHKGGNERKFV